MGLPLNQIVLGDCHEKLALFDKDSIDLTVFSPPYDDIRDYKNNWSFDIVELGKQLYEVTKVGGVVAVVIGDATKNFAKSLTSFRMAVSWVDVVGWKLFECVIYKRDGVPGKWWNTRFRVDHEYIFIFFKGDRPKTFNKEPLMIPSKCYGVKSEGKRRLKNGEFVKSSFVVDKMKCRGTVWEYSTSNTEGNRLKLQHPATFPDKLARDLILCFSEPNDIVLDPMCGSGTTCVQAKLNNRNFIGIEISEEYCDIAKKRLLIEAQGVQVSMF